MQVFLNQAGFLTNGCKTAVCNAKAERFDILDSNGAVRFSGGFSHHGYDENSGDDVYTADFSEFCENGTFRLVTDSGLCSDDFVISDTAYEEVLRKVCKAYYFLRCGCGLEERFAGKFRHAPCHTAPAMLWEENSVSLDVSGGWHDAGDYGRYVTAGAAALAHILYAYRLYPDVFKKQHLDIPESGETLPDILAECKVELDWIMKMQRSDGAVYHKATTRGHAPFIMPEEDRSQMYVLPVSSMATADTAAVFALASRIYREFDSEYADKLLTRAQLSARWLIASPDHLYVNPPECTTGSYGEYTDVDNRFWAWAELFATTDSPLYEEMLTASLQKDFPRTALGYGSVGGLGAMALLLCEKTDESLKNELTEQFVQNAEQLKQLSDNNGYADAMHPESYHWGSNMGLLKNGMIFAIAELFGKKSYRSYAEKQLHVLLGQNALGFSYVSGVGARSMENPHYRPTAADGIDECIAGFVSGGPNRHPADDDARRLISDGTPPMKCYADHVGAYSLNEITIYWNSPAVFLLAYLNTKGNNYES